MVYEFNNSKFQIKNSRELDNYFSNRLQNISDDEKVANNYIDYKDNNLVLCINNEKIIIDKKIKETDYYQIFNNYLSFLGNSDYSLYIHSSVISKNNKGFLLLGNFGQGKTTLSCLAQEYGYDINSADHSLLQLKNNKLFLKQGSTFVKENNYNYNIPYENSIKNIEIKAVVLLYGLSDNGKLSYSKIEDKYVLKRLYPFCSWHFTTPLSTNYDIELFNSKKSITTFLDNLDLSTVDVLSVRGDNIEIIKFFDNYLKTNDTNSIFINGLINNDEQLMKKAAISDLHVHGALGSSKDKYNVPSVKNIDGYTGFKEYIFKYVDFSSKDKYRDLLINTIKTEVDDGVKFLEMSIDIRYYDYFNSIEEYIEDLKNIKNMFKINIKYDIGISKTTNYEKFDVIYRLIETRFFSGIDLYGDENIDDFERFIDIYKQAKKYHLKRKVHIGEILNSNHLDKALVLNPNVIQHGIDIINNLNINKYLFNYITFNICLSSNIILGYVKDIKDHPIRKMYDLGLKITINTDDQLVFGKNIINEYKSLFSNHIFNENELDDIRKNGIY